MLELKIGLSTIYLVDFKSQSPQDFNISRDWVVQAFNSGPWYENVDCQSSWDSFWFINFMAFAAVIQAYLLVSDACLNVLKSYCLFSFLFLLWFKDAFEQSYEVQNCRKVVLLLCAHIWIFYHHSYQVICEANWGSDENCKPGLLYFIMC